MTINELLKARGLDDNAINGILEDMRANKLYLTSEENMDIRYPKLKSQHDGAKKQLEEALATIETLKQSTAGQEDAQKLIAEHEAREQALAAELEKVRILSEAKFALKDAGALDVDYLLFKLQEDGELALDDKGKIKGWDDKLAGLQTRMPAQFETKGGKKNIIENKLPKEEDAGGRMVTREEFAKMGYNSRVALKQENPELYNQMMKG